MLTRFQQYTDALIHLFYPQYCAACKSELKKSEQIICLRCIHRLPQTHFHTIKNNPVEKIFWGRAELTAATACFYFSKDSLLQKLVHQIKYHNRKDVAQYMGRWMGKILQEEKLFSAADAIVPVPLHPGKEKKRGYNQSALLAKGISEVLQIPVYEKILTRKTFTQTQTRKNRLQRWENVKDVFEVNRPEKITGQKILLIDDVITTGATMEACAMALQKVPGISISIAALAFASD